MSNTISGNIVGQNNFVQIAKKYAKVIDSRESTYRLALDLAAFDIPTLGAAAFRNFWNFLEAAWEAGIGTFMVYAAPKITTFVSKIASKQILSNLSDKEQNAADCYLRFSMDELKSTQTMEQALKRIENEEPKDQKRIAEIYTEMNKPKKAEKYTRNIDRIKDFCANFKPTDPIREKIYQLKQAVIIGESLIEGGVWGGFGFSLRWFRKNVIKKERFTGTMGYLSDAESGGLGEGKDLNLFQKLGGTAAIFLSPILNAILLRKTRGINNETKNKSSFLKVAENHLDMTHGIYPKLGLLFTYTTVPKWLGVFITSQGWYERIERLLKLCTIIPSWWLGHRVTNGILAKRADKQLQEEFNLKSGIMVEPKYLKPQDTSKLTFMEKLNYSCPEPARIHHILDTIENREKGELEQADCDKTKKESIRTKYESIKRKAEDLHASTLYKGFTLHSLLVWCITMLVNYSTKLRVKQDLGK